jgi:hypothetical protein
LSLHETGAVEIVKADFNIIMSGTALNVIIENISSIHHLKTCHAMVKSDPFNSELII